MSALKVGDRVITSGGIFGSITKVNEQSVQLQVAQNVRLEVARSAIVGYQGQEPVVTAARSVNMAKNLRWKLLIILGVIALSVFAFYPPDQKVRLGLDLKGGVHLVMRVQTDDAVRLETETTADRLREQMKAPEHRGDRNDRQPD